jgi:N-acetylmuramoyl-L-alanine amidase
MKSEASATLDPALHTDADRLAFTLLAIAAEESVRTMEALAACLTNRARRAPAAGARPEAAAPLAKPATHGDLRRKLEVGRRIARRALHGSLADPTQGATAFHRADATPGWARSLLPVAIFGHFLFYRPPTDVELSPDGET